MGFSNGLCVLCGEQIENIEHLLAGCQHVACVWDFIENRIYKYKGKFVSLTNFHKIVGILDKDVGLEEINMILSLVRWEIWKSRCKNQFGELKTKHTNLINEVICSIKRHIDLLSSTKKLGCRWNIKKLQEVFN